MRVVTAAAVCLAVLAGATLAHACSATVVWRADLSGAELVPPVPTDARGTARLDFRFGHPHATLDVQLQNAKDVTRIEVRGGDFERPGPVIFKLDAHGRVPRDGRFTTKVTEKDLKRQSSVHVRSFDDALRAVVEGTAYVSVSTKAHKHGELQGRITMRKEMAFSEGDADAAHDARLHERLPQTQSAAPPAAAD